MKALFVGVLVFSQVILADNTPLDLMTTCNSETDGQVFSLYRNPKNFHEGFLYDYRENEPVEHKVDIQYTDSGTRAIVTSEDLPTLILRAGKRMIHSNGISWTCPIAFKK